MTARDLVIENVCADGQPRHIRVYTCSDHDRIYIGGYSVVSAASEDEARRLLDVSLIAVGRKPYAVKPYTLQELAPDSAVVLWDGDY